MAHGLVASVLTVRDNSVPYRLPNETSPVNPHLLFHRLWVGDVRAEDRAPARAAHLAAVASANAALSPDLVRELHRRRERAVLALPGERVAVRVRVTPIWRLLVGHGEETPLESGMTMSPIHGVPMLPGSGLKGAAAAAARRAGWAPDESRRIFGGVAPDDDTDGDEDLADGRGGRRGSVILLDAFPDGAAHLVVDVLTPHAGPYYQGKSAPGEWLNPNPSRFLAVRDTTFRTVIHGPRTDVDQVVACLRAGADGYGLGAKTAAGYGYAEVAHEEIAP